MSIKVLAIDPGTKNLGWSIVSLDKDVKLHEFGLINLKEPPLCDLCDNPSFYFSFTDIEMKYCCKGHKENFEGCKKIKDKTIGELTDFLINKLKDTFENLEFDLVVLENQPAFKNPHMKSIQMIIFTYFKISDKKIIIQNPNIKFYGKKFERTGAGNGSKYIMVKKFSIECTKALLDKKMFVKLKEVGKLDDVSDAINHGVAYLCKGKEIPEKIKSLL